MPAHNKGNFHTTLMAHIIKVAPLYNAPLEQHHRKKYSLSKNIFEASEAQIKHLVYQGMV